MKFRLCLMTGIFGIALIAGVFEALNSLRGKEEPKEKKSEEKKAEVSGGVCDGL